MEGVVWFVVFDDCLVDVGVCFLYEVVGVDGGGD